ncbi:hypothetical protein X743_27010 [Mesorhizobium sp. LNHC252B00]|nr:hypothetical protein X743_27010 [Mesorhizobium sp. LNHC252B00]
MTDGLGAGDVIFGLVAREVERIDSGYHSMVSTYLRRAYYMEFLRSCR